MDVYNVRISLDNLKDILRSQVDSAQKGNLSQVESLSEKSASIVEEMSKAGLFDSAEYKQEKGKVKELYETLLLALTTQKEMTSGQLSQIRKTKKTIGAYHGNI
jgi:hypothetical protein